MRWAHRCFESRWTLTGWDSISQPSATSTKYYMPDKNIFCSSPWVHIKIGYVGRYWLCRWQYDNHPTNTMNVADTSILEFFNSERMNKFRSDILQYKPMRECTSCTYEDSFGKVSGRAKQLYRSNISVESFDQDYEKSPHREMFDYSENNAGQSQEHPYDLQINLSNVCNSACIMCSPSLSTRLDQDYKKLATYSPLFRQAPAFTCWTADPALVEKFIHDLKELNSIEYIHLLGGETLYLPSFYTICDALIESGLSENIFLGTTTNLTVYSDRLEDIIPKFKKFHIGLSIESVNPLNDYIRYPSEISAVLETLGRFLALREKFPTIHLTLRITPNIFSIFYLDEVIQFMCDNNITGESCNILKYPPCLRIELIPDEIRVVVIDKIRKVIERNSLAPEKVVDARNPNLIKQVISSVAFSYVDVLENMTFPADGEQCRHDLVTFLSGFESIRNNSILDYAPEYESFLTTYGYKHK